MAQYTWTTCSKVIQSEVNTLQTELQRLLGQNLLGMYLHGSLALGGFQPGRSDIDVIVVTAQRIDLETKRRCIELLLRISKMPCPLDIRFLVQHDLFLTGTRCSVICTIVKSGVRTINRSCVLEPGKSGMEKPNATPISLFISRFSTTLGSVSMGNLLLRRYPLYRNTIFGMHSSKMFKWRKLIRYTTPSPLC